MYQCHLLWLHWRWRHCNRLGQHCHIWWNNSHTKWHCPDERVAVKREILGWSRSDQSLWSNNPTTVVFHPVQNFSSNPLLWLNSAKHRTRHQTVGRYHFLNLQWCCQQCLGPNGARRYAHWEQHKTAECLDNCLHKKLDSMVHKKKKCMVAPMHRNTPTKRNWNNRREGHRVQTRLGLKIEIHWRKQQVKTSLFVEHFVIQTTHNNQYTGTQPPPPLTSK